MTTKQSDMTNDTQNDSSLSKKEQYRQTQLESARESLEQYEQVKERLVAFKEIVKEADKETLKELFGDVLADARSHNRDVVEARITLTDDGEIGSLSSVPMSGNAYRSGNVDLTFRVPCDSFLGYDDLQKSALNAIQHNIDGVSLNADEMRTQINRLQ